MKWVFDVCLVILSLSCSSPFLSVFTSPASFGFDKRQNSNNFRAYTQNKNYFQDFLFDKLCHSVAWRTSHTHTSPIHSNESLQVAHHLIASICTSPHASVNCNIVRYLIRVAMRQTCWPKCTWHHHSLLNDLHENVCVSVWCWWCWQVGDSGTPFCTKQQSHCITNEFSIWCYVCVCVWSADWPECQVFPIVNVIARCDECQSQRSITGMSMRIFSRNIHECTRPPSVCMCVCQRCLLLNFTAERCFDGHPCVHIMCLSGQILSLLLLSNITPLAAAAAACRHRCRRRLDNKNLFDIFRTQKGSLAMLRHVRCTYAWVWVPCVVCKFLLHCACRLIYEVRLIHLTLNLRHKKKWRKTRWNVCHCTLTHTDTLCSVLTGESNRGKRRRRNKQKLCCATIALSRNGSTCLSNKLRVCLCVCRAADVGEMAMVVALSIRSTPTEPMTFIHMEIVNK